jgi:dihydrofolate synthase/folylpolyglutamate synthase
LAQELSIDAQVAASLATAASTITGLSDNGRILICGSLYLAGQVLAENG